MKLIISLLVYNQLEVTKKCIESILKKSTSDYQLIISDNASRKETEDYLRSLKHPKIKYVRNDENIGFIKAHNKIYKETDSKYFCVLNNDLIIETKGWDSDFLYYFEIHQGLAQIGPKQNFGFLDRKGIGRPSMGRPLDYVEGSCFIVDKKCVDEVGGLFEDKYMRFAFSEDADLSLRLRSKNYKIGACPKTVIHHLHNQSFKNEKVNVDYKSMAILNNKFLCDRWGNYLKNRNFEPMKILVIREGAIGDCFLVNPIIRELKNKYPCSSIYVETKCGIAFQNNPDVVEIGTKMRGRYQFDKIIDLNMSYEMDAKKHIITAYAEKAEVILDEDKRIPVYYGLEEGLPKLKNTIVVNSEGSWECRTWPLDRWKKFITFLNETYDIIEVGTNPNYYLDVGKNLIGKTTLQQTVNLISRADMYIGFDGGLLHFAQAVGTPVFSIFGCTNPEYRIHNWETARVVFRDKNELNCSGCHHEGNPKVFTKCKQKEIYCLTGISLELVIREFTMFKKQLEEIK